MGGAGAACPPVEGRRVPGAAVAVKRTTTSGPMAGHITVHSHPRSRTVSCPNAAAARAARRQRHRQTLVGGGAGVTSNQAAVPQGRPPRVHAKCCAVQTSVWAGSSVPRYAVAAMPPCGVVVVPPAEQRCSRRQRASAHNVPVACQSLRQGNACASRGNARKMSLRVAVVVRGRPGGGTAGLAMPGNGQRQYKHGGRYKYIRALNRLHMRHARVRTIPRHVCHR